MRLQDAIIGFIVHYHRCQPSRHLPKSNNLSSLRASLLSFFNFFSISWFIRFCSFSSSVMQHEAIFIDIETPPPSFRGGLPVTLWTDRSPVRRATRPLFYPQSWGRVCRGKPRWLQQVSGSSDAIFSCPQIRSQGVVHSANCLAGQRFFRAPAPRVHIIIYVQKFKLGQLKSHSSTPYSICRLEVV